MPDVTRNSSSNTRAFTFPGNAWADLHLFKISKGFDLFQLYSTQCWTIRRCCLMHKRLPESWWPRVLSFHCWVASNDLVVGEAVYRKAITISHVWEHRNKSRKDNPLLRLEELSSIFVFKRHNRTNLGDCGFRLSSIRFLCNFSNIVPGGFFWSWENCRMSFRCHGMDNFAKKGGFLIPPPPPPSSC